jgi:hypothetical protein
VASAGTRGWRASLTAVTLALLLAVAWTARAGAAPLDAEACDKLEQEQADLAKAGAKQNMAKGPAWAAANLSPDRLAQIQRLIEVDEQITFRCSQPKAAKPATEAKAPPPKSPAAAADKAEAKAAAPTTKASQPAKTPPPKAPAAGADKVAAPAVAKKATAPAPTKSQAPKAAASQPAKPKANDAYVPPAKSEELPWGTPAQAQQ